MRLILEFLGLPQIYLDDKPIATDRRKAVALLAYLAVNDIGRARQNYSREALSALLWPDYEQAKAFSNLRRTIWEVHQALGEGWLIAERDSLHLNPDVKVDLDVTHFQSLLSQSRQQSDSGQRIPLLSEAVKLYRNHFLTGFSLKDAYSFNEWAYAESEELRRQLAEALTTLSEDYCSLGQPEKAIPYARRLISLDPSDEAAHRQLMEVYIQAGQHSLALKQYQTCEQILRKELNLDPQPETRALYKKIRKGEISPVRVEKQIETLMPRHNLPSQLSSFVGREQEQEEIINLLEKNRLVTLAGVGGIGKTRLSLQVGQKLLTDYPDGVWFIPLDSLSDPTLVPQTVASVFEIRESPDRTAIEILKNVLREKTTLLILDNCEHLLNSCAQLITSLLTNCPNLKFLTTSREILNMKGEATYYLPSLSIPEDNKLLTEKLTEYESIRLFTERAALAQSSFMLTQENAHAVVNICRRVDGIPLAIELASARVNILQVKEIWRQLNDSFALLASDSRSILPRQQTLQASMDWSWGLLTESEQIFLRQLSVFAGGWTLEAAQAVCDSNVLDLTSALVKKSLIMVDQKSEGDTRYQFHEIVREYMRKRLIESGAEEYTRTRHLQYFLQLSEEAEPGLKGPTQIKWMSRLNDERDNIRAALEWADKTDVEAGLYVSGRLNIFWEIFDIREGARWLERFVQKPGSKAHPHARAKALRALGWFKNWLERLAEAHSAAEESLDLYRSCGDTSGEVDALLLLAVTIHPSEAEEFFRQALTLAQSIGDKWRTAYALHHWGWDHTARHSYAKKALALFREVGDIRYMAECMVSIGRVEMLNNNIESAQKMLDRATILYGQLNIKSGMSSILQGYGRIAAVKGDYEQAYTKLQESAAIDEEYGYRINYLFDRSHLGYLALYRGNITEAHEIFTETVKSFFNDKNEIGIAFTLEGMAGLFVVIAKPAIAAQLIGWADALRERVGDPRPALEQAEVDKSIAACIIKMGEAAFSDAYDEGQKMSLDEAVAYSLKDD
ncbi:MAG TPA: BTAD domain-containing putative transcriptional regulator [Anaerolineales bacterium]|nr:BTAD domain-containing putative transcriptional regulator [Anaerolineales bacterium]